MKYGIDWNKENATDGGYLDDSWISSFLVDERDYNNEQLAQMGNFNAVVYDCYARMDKNTETLYLVLKLGATRKGSPSILSLILESNILDEKIEQTIELPKSIKSAMSEVRVVIPVKAKYDENLCSEVKYTPQCYDVRLQYKDRQQERYMDYKQNGNSYAILQSTYDYEDIVLNSEEITIQYGYMDVVHGNKFIPIENIEVYKNEDGIWTSDVVKNPEKYLKSDLDWYYSDERMVDYIEERGLLPQYKIDAIRAANYEDIFSMEYKIKHYGYIYLTIFFVFFALIVLIVMRKIIKRRKKDM